MSSEFDADACNDWVKANVLPKLPPAERRKTRAQIAENVREALLSDHEKPEIWGYFADYDWVVFCQLFGRMIDLPKGMPFWCRDLKQLMEDRGVERSDLPPDSEDEHDALVDARWIRNAYLKITTPVAFRQLVPEVTES